MAEIRDAKPVFDPSDEEYFADPRGLERIPLQFPTKKGGHNEGWIEVRKETSIGDRRAIFGKAVKGQTTTKDDEQRMEYDHERVTFGNVVLYLKDWSLKTAVSADAIRNLWPPVYNVIEEAVRAHIKRSDEGNAQTPPSQSGSPTSESAA